MQQLPEQFMGVEDVAASLRRGDLKKVTVLVGAGASVSSGIKDYRSAGGLYDTLCPDNLSCPTQALRDAILAEPSHAVSAAVFEAAPQVFLEVKRPLLLGLAEGEWEPAEAHRCLARLAERSLLQRVYTQNVDGFEAKAGVPQHLVRQVHGSVVGPWVCHYCGASEPAGPCVEAVRRRVRDVQSRDAEGAPAPPSQGISCTACGKLGMRPDVVLYGEAVRHLETLEEDIRQTDVLIVIGTSLTVQPMSGVPGRIPPHAPRIVIDRRHVGEAVGLRYGRGRDVMCLGDCDAWLRYFVALVEGGEEGVAPPPAPPHPKHTGTRVEVLLRSPSDLSRRIMHSREAVISIPSLDVDFSSFVTSGQVLTLRDFLVRHERQVRENMQMVMGGSTDAASGVSAFLENLRKLREGRSFPHVVVLDDATGEGSITGGSDDSPDTYRITTYPLTEAEMAKIGVAP